MIYVVFWRQKGHFLALGNRRAQTWQMQWWSQGLQTIFILLFKQITQVLFFKAYCFTFIGWSCSIFCLLYDLLSLGNFMGLNLPLVNSFSFFFNLYFS